MELGWANTRKILNPAGSGIPGIFKSGNFGFRVWTNFQFTLQKMAIFDFGSNFEAKRRISTFQVQIFVTISAIFMFILLKLSKKFLIVRLQHYRTTKLKMNNFENFEKWPIWGIRPLKWWKNGIFVIPETRRVSMPGFGFGYGPRVPGFSGFG